MRKGRPKNYIPNEDIRPLAAAFLKGEPVDGDVAVITREQTEEADYNLSPSRWVGQAHTEEQRPITEIISEMERLDKEAREIDARLAKMLAKLRSSFRIPTFHGGEKNGSGACNGKDYEPRRSE